jgi:hypothetical protein
MVVVPLTVNKMFSSTSRDYRAATNKVEIIFNALNTCHRKAINPNLRKKVTITLAAVFNNRLDESFHTKK